MKQISVLLFLIFFFNLTRLEEEVYITGNIDKWQLVDDIPNKDYQYIKKWSKDSTIRFYCFRQNSLLYCVGARYLMADKFIWNPKYLNRDNLPKP